MRKLALRLAAGLVVLGLLAVLGVVGGLWMTIRGSLPHLDGELALAGLSAPVRIERDKQGIPTLHAESRLDLAFATGFVHGQDRFFQMDLLRRNSSGELSALLGEPTVDIDLKHRVHRFRSRAQRVLEQADPDERALLEAYAEGVNAGFDALRNKPFEYYLLRAKPHHWLPEDSILVMYSMYLDLQATDFRDESTLGVMHDLLPPRMFEFLAPLGTEWDAPVEGWPLTTPRIPGPDVMDLRSDSAVAFHPPAAGDIIHDSIGRFRPGSNSWAVAGSHTSHGGALLADDMHLRIGVPNIWYRASFVWQDEEGRKHETTGVTLPGTPAMIVGSNKHIAWGFTNSQGDWSDLVLLESDLDDERSYRTPDGSKRFERHVEFIRVKGGLNVPLSVLETIWGPVLDEDHRRRRRALRWVAHDVEAVNLELMKLEQARSLEEALDIANRSAAPAQNFVVADDAGRIAWTIMGPIPRRVGFDGRLPRSWSDGMSRWDGYLEPEEYPRIIEPPGGRIWTANARVVGDDKLAKLGNGFYDLGARATQIRDGLQDLDAADERDMLAIQLDDRAKFLERWQQLLLELLDEEAVADHPRRAEMREHVEDWGGRASTDSVGYRLVRAYRDYTVAAVLGPLTQRCSRADVRCDLLKIDMAEGPAWRLVSERPPHLLNPVYATWEEQLLAAADAVLDELLADGAPLAERTWGEFNTTRIQHPLSAAVPRLSRWLDMPSEPLPGDSDNMPRIQGPSEGASQRMAVSPGRESEGYFHMPGGQCGHPLSPFYRNGHAAWAEGEPTPFLPGATQHTLVLVPSQ